jgi:STE24 endopeptidase
MKRVKMLLIAAAPVIVTGNSMAQMPVPQPAENALAFHNELFLLWIVGQLATAALALALLFTGKGAVLAGRCARLCGNRGLPTAALFACLCTFIYVLVDLTLKLFRAYRLDPYLGTGVVDVPTWLARQIAPALTLLLLGVVGGCTLYWLIRNSRKWWWAWFAAAISVLGCAYLTVKPLMDHAPQTFVPLKGSDYRQWESRIEKLGVRAGASNLNVVVKVTRPTDTCRVQNSAVGLGPTRTIVLSDQIFTTWDPAMIDVSVAHELKHYLYDNTWLPIALVGGFVTAGTFAVFALGSAITRRWSTRLRFDSIAAPASLPLIMLLLQLYLLVAIPAFNLIAQKAELDADRFALELTRDNSARARVSSTPCGRLWLANDTLFDRLYLNTHPSLATRIHLANTYKPWITGQPPRYATLQPADP